MEPPKATCKAGKSSKVNIRKISDFFVSTCPDSKKKKKNVTDDPVTTDFPEPELADPPPSSEMEPELADPPPSTSETFSRDFVDYIGGKISDEQRREIYSLDWMAKIGQTFPTKPGGKLRFQRHWIDQFSWLVYSTRSDGCFCKHCVAFAVEHVGKGGHRKAGKLINVQFSDWKHALETFKDHAQKAYHKDACLKADNFQMVLRNKMEAISLRLDSEKKRQVEENREKLKSIIATLIFCGRQELALRGDIDSGPVTLNEPTHNDGNFRALLRFRATSGDTVLLQHLSKCAANASYCSPDVQNEIISIIGDVITNKLVQKVNSAQCFAVLADEMKDVSGREQLSVCVRYVNEHDSQYSIREDFLSFVDIEKLTGEAIANSIESQLTNAGVDLQFLRGQGYDGASAMSGRLNGAQAKIKEKHKQAVYVHCASHSLNLVLNKCCTVQMVRNCFGIVSEICTFFHDSALRSASLRHETERILPGCKKTRLTKLCETRWVERHDAIFTFNELLDPVRSSLQKISETFTGDSSVKANQLFNSIDNAEFMLSMNVSEKMLAKTYHLSTFLQKENCDLVSCVSAADAVIKQVDEMRANSEMEFRQIFQKTSAQAATYGVEFRPRRGMDCNEDPLKACENHYRQKLFVVMLDFYSSQMKERFSKHRNVISNLCSLLPSKVSMLNESSAQALSNLYPDEVSPHLEVVKSEIDTWRDKWKDTTSVPQNAIEALNACNRELFPSIFKLLRVLTTLPVTSAHVERSFSRLGRIKDKMRSTMTERRLNGLTLLSEHRDIVVTPEEVLDIFCRQKRRLDLLL